MDSQYVNQKSGYQTLTLLASPFSPSLSSNPMGLKTFTIDDVSKHATEDDCWIIVHGKVYDMTKFLGEHPGGTKVVLNVAGKDASKQFDMFHNNAILEKYTPQLCIGTIGAAVDLSSVTVEDEVDLVRLTLFAFFRLAFPPLGPHRWKSLVRVEVANRLFWSLGLLRKSQSL